MPLKPNARFLRLEDAGNLKLPPEAKVVHALMADQLKRGDYVKLKVQATVPCAAHPNHPHVVSDAFWASFHSLNGDLMRVVVDNDLGHTHAHGLRCGDVIDVDRQYLLACIKS